MLNVIPGASHLLVTWTHARFEAVLTLVPWHWPVSPHVRSYVMAWLCAAALIMLLRIVSIGVKESGAFSERVLIVGSGPLVLTVIREIEQRLDHRFVVIGVVDDSRNGRPTPGLNFRLGALNRLAEIIDATRPDRIVIGLADLFRVPEQLLLETRIHGVKIEEAVNFYERVSGKLAIEALRPSSLFLSDGFHHSDFVKSDWSMSMSRLLSCLCAAAGLVALAPLLTLIALLVKIDSPGDVFFIQPRIGRGGVPFVLLKFRTMKQDAGARSLWVRDNADRITRVGKWLRRFRLDELPQFVNVLRGEMNLVGPRPHPMSNYQLFLENIPYYGLRSAVRPGITGWAQVRYGYANGLEEETEKMRYDLYYIKHRSLWLDMKILVSTGLVLVFDRRNHESVTRVPRDYWSEGLRDSASGAAS